VVTTVQTIEDATAWLDRVGVALLFPSPEHVLPSLWEAVSGTTDVDWSVRDGDGKFVSFSAPMQRVWDWKDQLPARRRGCIGLHVVRTTGLIAPRLVAAAYALTERRGAPEDFRDVELEPLQRELAEAALDLGRPTTRRELRLLVRREKREVDRAVNSLQRALIFTNAGRDAEDAGWASTLHDLFARRWRARLRRVPTPGEGRAALADAVVAAAGEVSAADLAAALRIRRKDAAALLEEMEARGLVAGRREEGFVLWTAVSSARSRPRGTRARGAQGRARSGR
jgi:hypothetical protein